MTKYEKRIYEIVNQSSSHMTVEQIYHILKADFPSVVLATVYNNLNKLYRDGLINKISVEGMPDRYDRIVKHDHIVCQNCGKLFVLRFKSILCVSGLPKKTRCRQEYSWIYQSYVLTDNEICGDRYYANSNIPNSFNSHLK